MTPLRLLSPGKNILNWDSHIEIRESGRVELRGMISRSAADCCVKGFVEMIASQFAMGTA